MSFRLEWVPPPQPEVYRMRRLPLYWIRSSGPLGYVAAVWEAPALKEYPAGLRRLLLGLLLEENRQFPQGELNRRLQRLGWRATWEATHDAILLQAEGLTENLPQALQLLYAMVATPILRGPAVQAHLERLIQAQERAWANPTYRADAHLEKALWGSAYALDQSAKPETLRQIQTSQLSAYHERFLQRGLRAIVLSAAHIPRAVEAWADWSTPVSYAVPVAAFSADTCTEGISTATQTSLRLASAWVRSVHPQYGLYRLALLRLGGYFGSQLMRILREEKGLTYGIYARAEETLVGSALRIAAEVRHDQAEAAIAAIATEVEKWAEEPFPTAEVLLECRNYLLAQLMPEHRGEWVRRIAALLARGRPLSLYYAHARQIAEADRHPWPRLNLPKTLPIVVAVGPNTLTFAPTCA